MKKVGILGGTFNPPHIGHLMIGDAVLDAAGLDEVRFMPNHRPPHKDTLSASDGDRKMMLELATGDHPFFSVEDIELERKGISYTIDTIRLLKEREPDSDFYFIIGGDMIDYLPKWKDIDELSELITFIGVRRPGYEAASPYPIQMIEMPELYLSSSMIRERIKAGKTVKYMLPAAVLAYIEENGLYET